MRMVKLMSLCWVVFSLVVLPACESKERLTREKASRLIRQAISSLSITVLLGDLHFPIEKGSEILNHLQRWGFQWSSVEWCSVFRPVSERCPSEKLGKLRVFNLQLPERWHSLVLKKYKNGVMLPLGRDPHVKVTGLRNMQEPLTGGNLVEAEFEYKFVETEIIKFYRTTIAIDNNLVKTNYYPEIYDNFYSRLIISMGLMIPEDMIPEDEAFQGKGKAWLALYDDGWRVIELNLMAGK